MNLVTKMDMKKIIFIGMGFSILLHVVYYYFSIVIFKLPPYRHPYWFSITGSVIMNALPIGLAKQESIRVGFVAMIFVVVTGIGLCFTMFANHAI